MLDPQHAMIIVLVVCGLAIVAVIIMWYRMCKLSRQEWIESEAAQEGGHYSRSRPLPPPHRFATIKGNILTKIVRTAKRLQKPREQTRSLEDINDDKKCCICLEEFFDDDGYCVIPEEDVGGGEAPTIDGHQVLDQDAMIVEMENGEFILIDDNEAATAQEAGLVVHHAAIVDVPANPTEPPREVPKVKDELVLGVLKCGHAFHFECIWKWMQARTKCPICRNFTHLTKDDIKAVSPKVVFPNMQIKPGQNPNKPAEPAKSAELQKGVVMPGIHGSVPIGGLPGVPSSMPMRMPLSMHPGMPGAPHPGGIPLQTMAGSPATEAPHLNMVTPGHMIPGNQMGIPPHNPTTLSHDTSPLPAELSASNLLQNLNRSHDQNGHVGQVSDSPVHQFHSKEAHGKSTKHRNKKYKRSQSIDTAGMVATETLNTGNKLQESSRLESRPGYGRSTSLDHEGHHRSRSHRNHPDRSHGDYWQQGGDRHKECRHDNHREERRYEGHHDNHREERRHEGYHDNQGRRHRRGSDTTRHYNDSDRYHANMLPNDHRARHYSENDQYNYHHPYMHHY